LSLSFPVTIPDTFTSSPTHRESKHSPAPATPVGACWTSRMVALV
jgi:hypothetical protein